MSPDKRNKIIGAHEFGIPLAKIAAGKDLNYDTCKHIWRQCNNCPRSQKDVHRAGKPKVYTNGTVQALCNATRRNPHLKHKEIRAEGLDAYRTTNARYLRTFVGGYKKRKAPKKPMIEETCR